VPSARTIKPMTVAGLACILALAGCQEAVRTSATPVNTELADTRQRLELLEKKVADLEHINEVANAAANQALKMAGETEEDRVERLKQGQATIQQNTRMMCGALPGQC
jgi:TolA-binding protein